MPSRRKSTLPILGAHLRSPEVVKLATRADIDLIEQTRSAHLKNMRKLGSRALNYSKKCLKWHKWSKTWQTNSVINQTQPLTFQTKRWKYPSPSSSTCSPSPKRFLMTSTKSKLVGMLTSMISSSQARGSEARPNHWGEGLKGLRIKACCIWGISENLNRVCSISPKRMMILKIKWANILIRWSRR